LLAEVIAGFERDVERGASGVLLFGAAVRKAVRLSVQVSEPPMVAAGDDLVAFDKDRADERVGFDIAPSAEREAGGEVEK